MKPPLWWTPPSPLILWWSVESQLEATCGFITNIAHNDQLLDEPGTLKLTYRFHPIICFKCSVFVVLFNLGPSLSLCILLCLAAIFTHMHVSEGVLDRGSEIYLGSLSLTYTDTHTRRQAHTYCVKLWKNPHTNPTNTPTQPTHTNPTDTHQPNPHTYTSSFW